MANSAERKAILRILGMDENTQIDDPVETVDPIKSITTANTNPLNKSIAQQTAKSMNPFGTREVSNTPKYGLAKSFNNVANTVNNKAGQYLDATAETLSDFGNGTQNLIDKTFAVGNYVAGNTDLQSNAEQDAQFAGRYTQSNPTITAPVQPTGLVGAASKSVYTPSVPDLTNPPVAIGRPNIDRTDEINKAMQAGLANKLGVKVNSNGVPVVDMTVGADLRRKAAGVTEDQLVDGINSGRNMQGGSGITITDTQEQKLAQYQNEASSQRKLLESNINEQLRVLNSDYNDRAKKDARQKLALLQPIHSNAKEVEADFIKQRNLAVTQKATLQQQAANAAVAQNQKFAQDRLLQQSDPVNLAAMQKSKSDGDYAALVQAYIDAPAGPQRDKLENSVNIASLARNNSSYVKQDRNDNKVMLSPYETSVEEIGKGKTTFKGNNIIKENGGAMVQNNQDIQEISNKINVSEKEINNIKNPDEKNRRLAELNAFKKQIGFK